MHYYKRNLGDYAKKAGRLSMLQHGSYTLLIDACYDREQFPTRAEAIDWTWASSTAEIEAVDFVLAKFFTLEGDRYVQSRIREELTDYHERASTNKRIADERETKRRNKSTKRAQVVNEAPPNHKPLTINQEPITKREGISPPADELPREDKRPPPRAGLAGVVCKAMKAQGLTGVSPSHPELIALIEAGADADMFSDAAKIAADKQKSSAYAISIVKRQMLDAKAITEGAAGGVNVRPRQPPIQSFQERDADAKRRRWEEMTGQDWPEDSRSAPAIDPKKKPETSHAIANSSR